MGDFKDRGGKPEPERPDSCSRHHPWSDTGDWPQPAPRAQRNPDDVKPAAPDAYRDLVEQITDILGAIREISDAEAPDKTVTKADEREAVRFGRDWLGSVGRAMEEAIKEELCEADPREVASFKDAVLQVAKETGPQAFEDVARELVKDPGTSGVMRGLAKLADETAVTNAAGPDRAASADLRFLVLACAVVVVSGGAAAATILPLKASAVVNSIFSEQLGVAAAVISVAGIMKDRHEGRPGARVRRAPSPIDFDDAAGLNIGADEDDGPAAAPGPQG
jgi:hypothetical protein